MVSARRPRIDHRDDPLPFGQLIPEEEWQIYRPVIEAAQARDIRFALGGGFAYSLYSGMWRNTKDLDVYVLPDERQRMIDAVTELGFEDYFPQKGYDRSWIYRSVKQDVIVDIIWDMPNHRGTVDDVWLTDGQALRIRNLTMRAIPPEELIFAKLYVFQRERCDWPDLLSVMHAQVQHIRWDHLLERVGDDAGLLGGLLRVFAWLCPEAAAAVPEPVLAQVGITYPIEGPDCSTQIDRVRLLDSRPWFAPLELTRQQEPPPGRTA